MYPDPETTDPYELDDDPTWDARMGRAILLAVALFPVAMVLKYQLYVPVLAWLGWSS